MKEEQRIVAKWILVVSGLFALMELVVSLSLFFFPQSMADKVDLTAKGVDFLIFMWASRQFALGIIFAYATIKKSVSMLALAYIFFGVMFFCDFIIGILQKDNSLIMGALMMCLLAGGLLFAIHKKK
jgi:hypothetical protein